MNSGVDSRNRDPCSDGIEFRNRSGPFRLNLSGSALRRPEELQSFKILINDASYLGIVSMDRHERFRKIVNKSFLLLRTAGRAFEDSAEEFRILPHELEREISQDRILVGIVLVQGSDADSGLPGDVICRYFAKWLLV